jgi:hypothetical protein
MESVSFEIECYTNYSPNFPVDNPCTLCNKTPTIGLVSFFLRGYLGTHITVHLCKEDWNDVGILRAISKALGEKAIDIDKGPTWKEILSKKTVSCALSSKPKNE